MIDNIIISESDFFLKCRAVYKPLGMNSYCEDTDYESKCMIYKTCAKIFKLRAQIYTWIFFFYPQLTLQGLHRMHTNATDQITLLLHAFFFSE